MLWYRFANYIPPDLKTHFKEDKENVYSNSLKSGLQNKRNSLLSFEYKKKYLFKKLIFVNQILDIYQISEKNIALSKIQEIKQDNIGTFTGRDYFTSTLIISETSNYHDSEFKNFKSTLSESDFNFIKNNTNSNTKRTVNFDLETKYILYGLGIGLDLWIIEFSHGPFFMFHETDINMKSCVIKSNHILFDLSQYINFNYDDMGEYCKNNSEKNLNIFTKKIYGI